MLVATKAFVVADRIQHFEVVHNFDYDLVAAVEGVGSLFETRTVAAAALPAVLACVDNWYCNATLVSEKVVRIS